MTTKETSLLSSSEFQVSSFRLASVGRQKVGYGMVVDGIAEFQALKFGISGPDWLGGESLRYFRRPDIWRIHPPPFHTPPFACLPLSSK